MALLNYTTEIPVDKTISEITRALSMGRAMAILTEYHPSGGGEVLAISFRAMTPYGVMSFRLPAKIDKVLLVLKRDPKIQPRFKTPEQAARVGWRIVKDWIEAQMALIRVDMATMEQVFLPYAQDNHGVTLYETLQAGKFNGLALPAPGQTPTP